MPTKKSAMTREAVLTLASKVSQIVRGTKPKAIGEWRYSDKNESASFVTDSPEGVRVVCLVSIFKGGDTALNFFSDEYTSELNKFENIGSLLYSGTTASDVREMVKDIKWVWKTVDQYQASWDESGR